MRLIALNRLSVPSIGRDFSLSLSLFRSLCASRRTVLRNTLSYGYNERPLKLVSKIVIIRSTSVPSRIFTFERGYNALHSSRFEHDKSFHDRKIIESKPPPFLQYDTNNREGRKKYHKRREKYRIIKSRITHKKRRDLLHQFSSFLQLFSPLLHSERFA